MRISFPTLILLACAFCASAAPAAEHASPASIPVEQFFKKAALTGASMSPDGRHVALRGISRTGRVMLSVLDVENLKGKSVANYGNADIDKFFWLSDDRIAFTVINVDQGGDVGDPGLYAIDRDGKNLNGLSVTLPRSRSFADSDVGDQAYLAEPSIAGFPSTTTDEMLVIEQSDGESWLTRLSTRSGRTSSIRVPRYTRRWLVDPDGQVKVAMTGGVGRQAVYFRADDKEWVKIYEQEDESAEDFIPLLYVNNKLYVRAHKGKDKAAIYLFDLATRTIDATPLIVSPDFDVNGYFVVDSKKMLGFRFHIDAEVTVWFDAAMKAIQEEIDQLLPGTINTLSVGRRSETPYVLIDAHSDRQDHMYLLFNRETKKRTMLGERRPGIDPAQMASMNLVNFTARDGLKLPAYVTLPNTKVQKNLPMVVLPGGLPWTRNGMWDWDAEVQFLASRGYAVIQPEPRGVPGFGVRHSKAGNKQWGLAMQDDLADAVKWAVAEGIADPRRVCIAGGGYGGYAAMMGLIKTPELYRCGVNWSGITDIQAMFDRHWEHIAEADAGLELRKLVGDPDKDAVQFKATSPLHHAARLKSPLLLAYGEGDQRVPFSHGRKLYEALKPGNPHIEWLPYKSSVEDWRTRANRINLWTRIEAFLGKHIGEQRPPAVADSK
ncbi:alpha/beta hydrolase family protein [Massilia sp. GCM10020059]|uniref:Prolyl oligopeptidase family serine peptidase n=1 Tax=Massilia agrisoli TaxID=2892444 RepID=A0ABS8IXH4_9BURK|nr:prolyl oligopeptidase family serine peptidase [Massilia agrisoli]MCC6072596.1 prolyl oligopeptidase family serine peptidase [Massilia agrisoli]